MARDIEILVTGLMLERLTERALAEGAVLQRITPLPPHAMRVECGARSAKLLLALAQRYGIRAEITARRGWSALAAWLIRRSTLAAGVAVFVALTWLALSRIWFVDVSIVSERPFSGSDAAILAELAEMGVAPGVPRRDVDPGKIALTLSAETEGYSHIGARLTGVRLEIEAAPEIDPPGIFRADAARDLVADRDGVVLRVNALSGLACVAPGDAVRAGQVLIRGEERDSAEATRGVAALGEVLARGWRAGESQGCLWREERVHTGRADTSASLMLFDWEIPLTHATEYARFEADTSHLPVGGLFLPLEIRRTRCREYALRRVPEDEDTLKARLSALALADALGGIDPAGGGACTILDKWIDYQKTEDGTLRARAVVEICSNIAVTREAFSRGG